MERLWLVILYGLLSTIQLHISKAMERHYIDAFKVVKEQMNKKDKSIPIDPNDKRTFYLYVVALILNNTVLIYSILAGAEGLSPTYFSSVFGIGLIGLMIYSHYVMKEKTQKVEIIGAIVLVFGTLVIGFESLSRPEYDMTSISATSTIIVIVVFLLVGAGLMSIAFKSGKTLVVGVIFGLFAGGCGGMDPFLKGIGQNQGTEGGIVPSTGMGWVIFILSFLTAFLAFTFTQWGFAKGAKASVLVSAYNSSYVILPIIFSVILFEGYVMYATTYIAIVLIVIGIVLMQSFKPEEDTHLEKPPSTE